MNKVEQALELSKKLGNTNGVAIVIDGPIRHIVNQFDGSQFTEHLFEVTGTPFIKDKTRKGLSTVVKQATLLTTMLSSPFIGAVFAKSDDKKMVSNSGEMAQSAELIVDDSSLTTSEIIHTYRMMGGVVVNELLKNIESPIGIVYAQQPVEEAEHRLYFEIYKFMKDFESTERSYRQAIQWNETGGKVPKMIEENERNLLIAALMEADSTINNFKKSEITSGIAEADQALRRTGLIEKYTEKMPYQSVSEKMDNIVKMQEALIKNYDNKEKRHSLMKRELTELKELEEHLNNLEPLIKLSEIGGATPETKETSIKEGKNYKFDLTIPKTAEKINIKVKRTKPEFSFQQRLGSWPEYKITIQFPVYSTTTSDLLGWSTYVGRNRLYESTNVANVFGQNEVRHDVTVPVNITVVDHGGDRCFLKKCLWKGPDEGEIKVLINYGNEKTKLSNAGKYLKSVKEVLTPLTKARRATIENELSGKQKPIIETTPIPTIKPKETPEVIIKETPKPTVKPKETPKPIETPEISKAFKMGNILPSTFSHIEYTDAVSIENGLSACCKNSIESAMFRYKDEKIKVGKPKENYFIDFTRQEFGDANSFRIEHYKGFDIEISDYLYYYDGYREEYIPYEKGADRESYVEIQNYIVFGYTKTLKELIDFYQRGDVLNKKKMFNEMLSTALKYTDDVNRLTYTDKEPYTIIPLGESLATLKTFDSLAKLTVQDFSPGYTQIDVYKFASETEAKEFAVEYKKQMDKKVSRYGKEEDKKKLSYNFYVEDITVVIKWILS